MSGTQKLRPVGFVAEATGARVVRHWRGVVALDNYEPVPREYAVVQLEEWAYPERAAGWTGLEFVMIEGLDKIKKAPRARWLLDDGETLRVMYTTGWHETGRYIGLKTLTPSGSNVPGDGPRHMFHVKMTLEAGE